MPTQFEIYKEHVSPLVAQAAEVARAHGVGLLIAADTAEPGMALLGAENLTLTTRLGESHSRILKLMATYITRGICVHEFTVALLEIDGGSCTEEGELAADDGKETWQ